MSSSARHTLMAATAAAALVGWGPRDTSAAADRPETAAAVGAMQAAAVGAAASTAAHATVLDRRGRLAAAARPAPFLLSAPLAQPPSRVATAPVRGRAVGRPSRPGPPPLCDGRRATRWGTDADDFIVGTPGVDVIAGLGGDDEIRGLGQDDLVCGGPGRDLVFGGAGDDVLLGEDGSDLLDGGVGDDAASGGPGSFDGAAFFDSGGPVTASLATGTASGQGVDTFTGMEELHGGAYGDTFTGDAGSNLLFGNGGEDVLFGGAGNDYLSGGAGDDTIDGGAHVDAVSYWDANGPVTVSLTTAASSGAGGNDTFADVESISGGPYADVLEGDAADNVLDGDAGDDMLSGLGGDDNMNGGAGDDAFDGGPSRFGDIASYWDSEGPISASLATGTAAGGGGNDTFVAIEGIAGGPYADVLEGDAGRNSLSGHAGDDVLTGGAGDDMLSGGAGDDTIDGGAHFWGDSAGYWDAETPVTANLAAGIASGRGNDTLFDVETLHGGAYGDTLVGNADDNGLFGNGGNDTLEGGSGNDNISGGPGDDAIDGGPSTWADTISFWDASGPVTASLPLGVAGGGSGADTFTNVEGLNGGRYGDALTGDAADNWLFGDAGDDTLVGGAGNDHLNGGTGNDAIDGGPHGWGDTVGFWNAAGAVTASLVTGTSTGDGDDTLGGVEHLQGGDYADTLIGDGAENGITGGAGDDVLKGGGGDDFLNGEAGDDTIDGGPHRYGDGLGFWSAPGPVAASLATGSATGDGDDTFSDIEQLFGGEHDDTLAGDAGDNVLFGNRGDDTLTGGDGNDFVNPGLGDDFIDGGAHTWGDSVGFSESGPVNASLATGTATGHGTDTLTGVEQLHGGDAGDTLTGGTGNDTLMGNGGDDTIVGGAGDDWLGLGAGDDSVDGGPNVWGDSVSFWNAPAPVTASLVDGVATGEGADAIAGVEQLHGGAYGDTLTGDDGNNVLFGNGGDDSLLGGGGNDLIDAGPGTDTVDGGAGIFDGAGFWDARGPIVASLVTGVATGDGDDSLVNVEELHGGDYDDTLVGNDGDNAMWGNRGDDFLDGRAGWDHLDGGDGVDGCVNGESLHLCE